MEAIVSGRQKHVNLTSRPDFYNNELKIWEVERHGNTLAMNLPLRKALLWKRFLFDILSFHNWLIVEGFSK